MKHIFISTFLTLALSSTIASAQSVPTFDPAGNPAPTTNTPIPQQNPYSNPYSNNPYGIDAYGSPSANTGIPIDQQTLNRSNQQMQGDYGTLDRSMGLPLGMTQDAWSKPFDNMAPGQQAPGVVTFEWTKDLIMPIRIRDLMNTMIVLPEWENIVDVFIGENQNLEATIVRSNVVAVRTNQAGIDTNLTLVGQSGALYTFYLRAEGFNTKKITDIMVYVKAQPISQNSRWFKGTQQHLNDMSNNNQQIPNNGSMQNQQSAPLGQVMPYNSNSNKNYTDKDYQSQNTYQDMIVPREKMTFNMSMFEANPGDAVIAPDYVYTDGVWTYLHYDKNRAGAIDRPVIYRIVDGIENRINTRTAGRFGEVIIVEAVGDFVLRNGDKIVCLKESNTTIQ